MRFGIVFFTVLLFVASGCASSGGDSQVRADKSFNSTGYVLFSLGAENVGEAFSVRVDRADNVVAVGYWGASMAVWRYGNRGEPDSDFGSGQGYVLHGISKGSFDKAYGGTLDRVGRIVTCGYTRPPGASGGLYMATWRLLDGGGLDENFAGGGYVTYSSGGQSDVGYAVAVDSEDRILIAGGGSPFGADYVMRVWRFLENGTSDASFGQDGTASHAGWGLGPTNARGLTLSSSGAFYVAGSSNNGQGEDMILWRYLENGTLDAEFGLGKGFVVGTSSAMGEDSGGLSVAEDSLGRVLVAGFTTVEQGNKSGAVWRFLSGGVADPGFGDGGMVLLNDLAGPGEEDEATGVAVDQRDRAVIVGTAEAEDGRRLFLMRLDENGEADEGFAPGGYILEARTAGGHDVAGDAVVMDDRGRFLIPGISRTVDNRQLPTVWRFRK